MLVLSERKRILLCILSIKGLGMSIRGNAVIAVFIDSALSLCKKFCVLSFLGLRNIIPLFLERI